MDTAILNSLWSLWQRETVASVPTGQRIFVRWIMHDPPAWDDWSLAALVMPEITLRVVDPDDDNGDIWLAINAALERGEHQGVWCDSECRVQWCRADGDGPEGERTSDILGLN